MSSPETEIYFFHIAKTAGSSLASLIRNAYSEGEAIPVYECQDLATLTLEQINSYRCYTGHFGTGLYSLVNREIPTVTLLRDPFEQTVSHLFHAMRKQLYEPESWKYRQFLWRHLSAPGLRQWLKLPDFPIPLLYFSEDFFDFQTRNLGVEFNLVPLREKTLIELLNDAEQGQSRDEILESAKRRLDSMAVVGTVERFSESVGLICDLIGIPAPPAPPEENVAPGRTARSRYRDSGEISPALAALIEQNTQYDKELYAYANKLLDQKLAQKKSKACL